VARESAFPTMAIRQVMLHVYVTVMKGRGFGVGFVSMPFILGRPDGHLRLLLTGEEHVQVWVRHSCQPADSSRYRLLSDVHVLHVCTIKSYIFCLQFVRDFYLYSFMETLGSF
jgi:hypothetical protein